MTTVPRSSGPRCASESVARSSTNGGTVPFVARMPKMPHMVGTYLNVNHNLPPASRSNSLKIWLKMRVIASRLTFRYAYGGPMPK